MPIPRLRDRPLRFQLDS
eukprot:gene26982-biopygen17554